MFGRWGGGRGGEEVGKVKAAMNGRGGDDGKGKEEGKPEFLRIAPSSHIAQPKESASRFQWPRPCNQRGRGNLIIALASPPIDSGEMVSVDRECMSIFYLCLCHLAMA